MPGCIFEHYGRIPESLYAAPKEFKYRLEQAVFDNNTTLFDSLVKVSEFLIFESGGLICLIVMILY